MEMAEEDSAAVISAVPLENRHRSGGIFILGSPNVGKRTILSRLLSLDIGDDDLIQSTTDPISCHGWTIDTKYYSADVSVWTAQLDQAFPSSALPILNKCQALVLVFDLNDLSSFVSLQDWVSSFDMNHFEILLCIGNKADLLPGHFAHHEYRRYLQKRGESSSDPHPKFSDYGILETEGTSLLGEDKSSWEIRKSCLEWCIQHSFEYVEACGSNPKFDKCLSLDGDIQGLDRLYGALSAHMWPGMLLKSGTRVAEPFPPKNEIETEESDDSEYEVQYEILSGGFQEPWDDYREAHVAFSELANPSISEESTGPDTQIEKSETCIGGDHHIPTSTTVSGSTEVVSRLISEDTRVKETSISANIMKTMVNGNIQEVRDVDKTPAMHGKVDDKPEEASDVFEQQHPGSNIPRVDEPNGHKHFEYDDLERLMSEIGNMRGSLRLMPDFQRRDMAAKLAMKMAVMFECTSDEEGFE